ATTNVRTGKIKVFDTRELSASVLMASACLPLMFRAVEIDGQHYWDGGYMGNPAIFPLIYGCDSPDVVIVHINSIEAQDVMADLGVSSKLNPDWDFLSHLRDVGRARADHWLVLNYGRIGRESTVDLRVNFL